MPLVSSTTTAKRVALSLASSLESLEDDAWNIRSVNGDSDSDVCTPTAASKGTLSIASSMTSSPIEPGPASRQPLSNTDLCVPMTVMRRSSRIQKLQKPVYNGLPSTYRKTLIDAGANVQSASFTKEKWQLFSVMELDGCEKACAINVHGLTEYDILEAHEQFCSKPSCQEKRQWIFDYLATHCPLNGRGEKDPSKLSFFLSGREMCQSVWLAILSVSQSSFYEIRKQFVSGQQLGGKKIHSKSAKSMQAIAWMTSYFERIGDKRPDKDGIYLPTYLTVNSIYNHMIESLYKENRDDAICFSQFSNLYRIEFPNVSIPKVCNYKCLHT